jgi:hypothetical protein
MFFLKPLTLSSSRNISLPALYLENFCTLIKVQIVYCMLSYALLGSSRTLCLYSLIVTLKAKFTDHIYSICLRGFVAGE